MVLYVHKNPKELICQYGREAQPPDDHINFTQLLSSPSGLCPVSVFIIVHGPHNVTFLPLTDLGAISP